MTPPRLTALALAAALGLACGTTRVENVEQYPALHERRPKPPLVMVYDFEFDPRVIEPDETLSADTLERRREIGREISSVLAQSLVDHVREELDTPATRASERTRVPLHAILIQGRFEKIDQGASGERMLLGFGAGMAKLRIHVYGAQQTSHGPELLAEGDVYADSGRKPGVAGPGVAAAAAGVVAGVVVTGTVQGYDAFRGAVQEEADRIAGEIVKRMKMRFQQQGWIP